MVGSAKVEMSPKSRSPTAIFLRTRRMIFPDRVLGSPGASWMKSGVAKGPILPRTVKMERPHTKISLIL